MLHPVRHKFYQGGLALLTFVFLPNDKERERREEGR